jgi:hypothetical protein
MNPLFKKCMNLLNKIQSTDLPKFIITPLLRLSCIGNKEYFWVMAYGYSDDEDYVQMIWEDDKDNCLDYEKYQIWFNN